ncbi:hypothetical protein [Paenibacillus sp. SAFN-117]|uniref:hypothetical protein n=1 Tax=Paenibacillus sp. SAFN-117 TaxID=3436860 RepID=UPI003F809493
MEYQYVTSKSNYEDLASGKVIESRKGMTSFPVRLASELFQRGVFRLQNKGVDGPYTVYDPCCGGGYLLTVIGLLHGDRIAGLYGSDIREEAVALTQRNLSLLSEEGLERRMEEIRRNWTEYGKDSHQEALHAAERIKEYVIGRTEGIRTGCIQADIMAEADKASAGLPSPDLIIADVPYGQETQWGGTKDAEDPLYRMLDQLQRIAAHSSVLIVIADKGQKIRHEGYRRLEALRIGKRQAAILERL